MSFCTFSYQSAIAPSATRSRLGVYLFLVTARAGTGKSHLAQAIGFGVIQQGYRVLYRYRETHVLLEELADAQLGRTELGNAGR